MISVRRGGELGLRKRSVHIGEEIAERAEAKIKATRTGRAEEIPESEQGRRAKIATTRAMMTRTRATENKVAVKKEGEAAKEVGVAAERMVAVLEIRGAGATAGIGRKQESTGGDNSKSIIGATTRIYFWSFYIVLYSLRAPSKKPINVFNSIHSVPSSVAKCGCGHKYIHTTAKIATRTAKTKSVFLCIDANPDVGRLPLTSKAEGGKSRGQDVPRVTSTLVAFRV